MKTYIYTGGEIHPQHITEKPEPCDLVIAADSGYDNAKKLGQKVDILIGDFDSLAGGQNNLPDDVPEILQAPEKKDHTDTQLAVETAIKKGAREIVIIGSTCGRLDHTMSMLSILESLHERGVSATILNGQNRIRFLKNSSTILLRSHYKYFSIIAVSEKVKGLCIDGAMYPLKNKEIKRNLQFAVSNEIEKNCALISVKRGSVFVVEAGDNISTQVPEAISE